MKLFLRLGKVHNHRSVVIHHINFLLRCIPSLAIPQFRLQIMAAIGLAGSIATSLTARHRQLFSREDGIATPVFVNHAHLKLSRHFSLVRCTVEHDSTSEGAEPSSVAPAEPLVSLVTNAFIRDVHFAHHGTTARLNHGSFGTPPLQVIEEQSRLRSLWLSQPDAYSDGGSKFIAEGDSVSMDGQLEHDLKLSRAAAAELLNPLSVEEVVLVDDVTTAATMVATHLAKGFQEGRYAKGDKVLFLGCSHPPVKKCFEAHAAKAGAEIVSVHVPFPLESEDEVVEALRLGLEAATSNSGRVALAVLDHVTSMPSMVLPIKRLVALCHSLGVPVFVDGAHAVGNVEVDVQNIGAEYYAADLHKWAFCPASVAAFHAKQELISELHHPITSQSYGEGLFKECARIGTCDYSAQLSVPIALRYIDDVIGGISRLRKRNRNCLEEQATLLAGHWFTEVGAPPSMCASMTMVELPEIMGVRSEIDALKLETTLREEYDVEVPVFYVEGRFDVGNGTVITGGPGIGYVRLSHQVYNTPEDFTKLRTAVEIMSQLKRRFGA